MRSLSRMEKSVLCLNLCKAQIPIFSTILVQMISKLKKMFLVTVKLHKNWGKKSLFVGKYTENKRYFKNGDAVNKNNTNKSIVLYGDSTQIKIMISLSLRLRDTNAITSKHLIIKHASIHSASRCQASYRSVLTKNVKGGLAPLRTLHITVFRAVQSASLTRVSYSS